MFGKFRERNIDALTFLMIHLFLNLLSHCSIKFIKQKKKQKNRSIITLLLTQTVIPYLVNENDERQYPMIEFKKLSLPL